MALEVTRYNPIDHMETDEEIIEFLVDCFMDDLSGKIYQRGIEFLCEAKGLSGLLRYHTEVTRRVYELGRQGNAPDVPTSPALALRC